MVKTEGAVYNTVVCLLRARGESVDGIGVATLSRGSDHLVVRGEEVIGGYNHVSRKLQLHKDITQT